MDEMTLTLNNPLTEEEWDLIEDVDFDKTNSIEFHTKHGKTVKFVKCTDEKTEDMISRQAAIDALHMHLMYRMGTDSNKKRLDEWINNLPPAKPERKKGEWIPVTNGRGGFECDQCHNYAPSYQDGVEWLSGFCPNCGADMRGKQDDSV